MRLKLRLFGPRGRVPEGQVVYAIGDVHGRDDLLGRLHDLILEDLAMLAGDRCAQVIYLGDYIDRGPDSRGVLDRLTGSPLQGVQTIFLKGNHEDAMLKFLDEKVGGDAWLSLGGGATAKSYGVALRGQANGVLPLEIFRENLKAAVPERHLAFLRNLTLSYDAGDYFFVHAGIRPGKPIEEQSETDMLWIKGEFLRSRRKHGRVVVHGHASSHDVVVKRNRICVDTMAFATDRLSCVVLEGDCYRFLSAEL